MRQSWSEPVRFEVNTMYLLSGVTDGPPLTAVLVVNCRWSVPSGRMIQRSRLPLLVDVYTTCPSGVQLNSSIACVTFLRLFGSRLGPIQMSDTRVACDATALPVSDATPRSRNGFSSLVRLLVSICG